MSAIDTLASALYSACIRDLPDIEFNQVDVASERAYLDRLTPDQRREYHALRAGCKTDAERAEFFAARGISTTVRRQRPSPDYCEVTMWSQTWESTALGYGGIGGQAVTDAYTVIVLCKYTGYAAVYFGGSGRLAYLVPPEEQNDVWHEAIHNHQMPRCRDAADLYGWHP
jgi:hypothetical protein